MNVVESGAPGVLEGFDGIGRKFFFHGGFIGLFRPFQPVPMYGFKGGSFVPKKPFVSGH